MTILKKIVLLGDCAVGKTSLIRRYVFNRLGASYNATIGSKVVKKEIKIQEHNRTENLKLIIWDLIGSKGYSALHARTFVGVNGALLVSDFSRWETLESLEDYWIPSLLNIVDNVPLVFIANKSDLKSRYEFEFEDLVEVTTRYNVSFDGILPSGFDYCYSTSAKYGDNVGKAFESMAHLVLRSEDDINPMTELYGGLVAARICKSKEKITPIGLLDAIIVDFCEGFEDTRIAMWILRQEITRAKININRPTKQNICRVIDYLVEAENEFLDNETVYSNFNKRMNWANQLEEREIIQDKRGDFETLRPLI